MANIINAGIPFLLLPLLTRILTPVDYGIVGMFGVMLSIFSAFTGLSVQGAISVRYFQLDKTALAQYIGACISILIISTGVVLLVVAVSGSWLAEISGVPEDWLLIAVALSSLQFIVNIQLSIWQAAGKPIQYGSLQVSQSLVNAGLSLVLILGIGMAWQGRVWGQAAGIIVGTAFAFWCLIKNRLIEIPSNWRIYTIDAVKFGVPLIPHTIGGLVLVAGDRLIIQTQLGGAATGVYMAAFQLSAGLTIIYGAFFKVWHPEITKRAVDLNFESRSLIVAFVYKIIIYSLLVLAIYCVLMWFGYPYLLGRDFIDGRIPSMILALAAFFSACYYSTAIFIMVSNRNELLALNTFVSGIVGLGATYFFCGYFGLIGAALGVLLGNILSFVLCWYSSNVVYPMPWLRPIQ